MPETDLWTIPEPHHLAATLAEWWAQTDETLRVVAAERRANGCDCDAPPWFSPPGEWPMKVLLSHAEDCGNAPTYEEALEEGRGLGLLPAQRERYARRVGRRATPQTVLDRTQAPIGELT